MVDERLLNEVAEYVDRCLSKHVYSIDKLVEETNVRYASANPEIWKPFIEDLEELKVGHLRKADGKSIGTFIEKMIKVELSRRLNRTFGGNAAVGVDIPELNLGMKATSITQPQSSEPFGDPYQRIFGIGNSVFVFIYKKTGHDIRRFQSYLLSPTNMADKELCNLAKTARDLLQRKLINEETAKRVLRLIVLANKRDAEFKDLYTSLGEADRRSTSPLLVELENKIKGYEAAKGVFPFHNEGLLTDAELRNKFMSCPLDGKVSVSYALQWRFQYPEMPP